MGAPLLFSNMDRPLGLDPGGMKVSSRTRARGSRTSYNGDSLNRAFEPFGYVVKSSKEPGLLPAISQQRTGSQEAQSGNEAAREQ